MTHGDRSQIVIVGGVLNRAYSFVTGFFLAKTRRTSPHALKYPEREYSLMGSVLSFPER